LFTSDLFETNLDIRFKSSEKEAIFLVFHSHSFYIGSKSRKKCFDPKNIDGLTSLDRSLFWLDNSVSKRCGVANCVGWLSSGAESSLG
jgi:hypothetical protein